MYTQDEKPKMALFVSKYDHCLYDILGRYSAGELPLEIPLIISNHEDLKSVAERFSIPFHYIPFTKDIKDEGGQKQLELLQQYQVDFIVLARYMQIIPPNLIAQYKNKIINIDVPIVLGILMLYGRSIYEVVTDYGPGYFDTLCGLLFFMLLGKLFQKRTYNALSYDRDYKSFYPIAVTKVDFEGKQQNILLNELNIGDRIMVRNQEIIRLLRVVHL